jgi:hypothetical protein
MQDCPLKTCRLRTLKRMTDSQYCRQIYGIRNAVKSLARTLELVQNFNAVPLCMKPASIHFNVDFFRRDGQRKVLAEPMPTFDFPLGT